VRKKLGTTLSVLGGFLILVALLGMFYAPGPLMKTPLDVDAHTSLSGSGQLGGDTVPVKAFSVTYTDSEKSDDDVAVWVNSSCLVKDEGDIDGCVSADDPEERLLSASTDNFASDRYTGLAVNDPKYLPAEAEPHEGLVNKWPFESEKKTYPYWDGLIGDTVDAEYDRTEEVLGLETYVYKVSISDADIEITDGVPGTYDDEKEIWVEPVTGAIVDQSDSQVRYGEDGEEALSLELSFTDEEVEESVEEAESNAMKLNLVTKTVPLIGFIVGIPMAIIGIALLVLGRRKENSTTSTSDEV
jgi:hypothetical protein